MTYSIIVNISDQTLCILKKNQQVKKYRVATAKNGAGEQLGSECTPRGKHIIRAKIGDKQALNTVYIGRRPSGEIYEPALKKRQPNRDWILTRILWLSGLEKGKNRSNKVDTMRRYVYIHGCPDEDPMGIPSSHGCVKMRNTDLIELYNLIPVYTRVNIVE